MKISIKTTAFIHAQRSYGGKYEFTVFQSDVSGYGYFLVCKKEIEVTADIDDNFSIDAAEIASLKEQKKKIQAEANKKIVEIEERIQSLLCIEYKEI